MGIILCRWRKPRCIYISSSLSLKGVQRTDALFVNHLENPRDYEFLDLQKASQLKKIHCAPAVIVLHLGEQEASLARSKLEQCKYGYYTFKNNNIRVHALENGEISVL